VVDFAPIRPPASTTIIYSDHCGSGVEAHDDGERDRSTRPLWPDAIDLRWTLMDIAARRTRLISKQHLAQLLELVS
jgi:hypothetical protein